MYSINGGNKLVMIYHALCLSRNMMKCTYENDIVLKGILMPNVISAVFLCNWAKCYLNKSFWSLSNDIQQVVFCEVALNFSKNLF